MHIDRLEQANRDLANVTASTSLLEEEVRSIQDQLTSYYAGANITAGPAQELAKLKTELVQLRSVYLDAHPNVQAVRQQISAIERQMAPSRNIQNLRSDLAKAEAVLEEVQKSSPLDEALIAEKRQAVDIIRDELSTVVAQQSSGNSGDFLSSQIQARLDIANNRLRTLRDQAQGYRDLILDLQARIARTPEVERGLAALTRDHTNIFGEYQEVLSKQQSAQLAENLEDNQRAEKFSILEQALRPDKPSSPERGKLSVLAILMALGAGAVCAMGAELLLATLRGRNHLSNVIGGPPIAVIPYIQQENGRRMNMSLLGRKTKRAA